MDCNFCNIPITKSCLRRNSMRIMLGNGRKAFSTPQQYSSITSFISGILESCLIGVLSHYYVNCFHCSKWAQLTLIRLLTARESFSRSRIERLADEVEKLQKLQGLLRELTHIDLPHSEYYQHEQSLLILREVNLLSIPLEPVGFLQRFGSCSECRQMHNCKK